MSICLRLSVPVGSIDRTSDRECSDPGQRLPNSCTKLIAPGYRDRAGHTVGRQRVTVEEANTVAIALPDNCQRVFDYLRARSGLRSIRRMTCEPCPRPTWERMCEEIKAEVRGMGLETL